MSKSNPPLNKIRHTGPNSRGGLSLGELMGRPFMSDDDAVAAFLNGDGNADEARAAAESRLNEDRRAHKQGKGNPRHPHLELGVEIAQRLIADGVSEYQAFRIAAAEAQNQTGQVVLADSIKKKLKRSKTK
jgi:hypothetical protein